MLGCREWLGVEEDEGIVDGNRHAHSTEELAEAEGESAAGLVVVLC